MGHDPFPINPFYNRNPVHWRLALTTLIFQHDLKVITMLDDPQIKVSKLNGKLWYEINDIEDLKIVEILFCEDKEEKLDRLHKTYGGYWRFPGLLDYYYLVNPYFPPKRMVEEMIASYPSLLTQYPSGMKVNALLASRNFNIRQENIVIGNGSSELIKSVMGFLDGRTGFSKNIPTDSRRDRLSSSIQHLRDIHILHRTSWISLLQILLRTW